MLFIVCSATKEIQVSGVSGGAFVCEFLKSMNYDCGDSNCGAVYCLVGLGTRQFLSIMHDNGNAIQL